MAGEAITATSVGLMVGSPVAYSVKIPFVQIVLFEGLLWNFTIADLGFVVGFLLALAKIWQMLRHGS
jgi:hypothetical protein